MMFGSSIRHIQLTITVVLNTLVLLNDCLTHTEAHRKLQHDRDGLWGQSSAVGRPLHQHQVVFKLIVACNGSAFLNYTERN